ncbi:MAG: hypothetical protein ACREDP_22595, partial [Bradyrhizobium sp.]
DWGKLRDVLTEDDDDVAADHDDAAAKAELDKTVGRKSVEGAEAEERKWAEAGAAMDAKARVFFDEMFPNRGRLTPLADLPVVRTQSPTSRGIDNFKSMFPGAGSVKQV